MNTNHLAGVLWRIAFDRHTEHSSAVDESLHDEVSHCDGEDWLEEQKVYKVQTGCIHRKKPTSPGQASSQVMVQIKRVWGNRKTTV